MQPGTKKSRPVTEGGDKARQFTKVDPPSDVRKVSSEDALYRIKTLAEGWKDEFVDVLNLPRELFMYNEGNLLVLSKDEALSVTRFLPAMKADADPPRDVSAYGIAVYETSGTSYLVFVDTQRRIVVRDRTASFHSDKPEDWGRIMGVIRDALTLAGTNPSPDTLVFVDEARMKRKVLQ